MRLLVRVLGVGSLIVIAATLAACASAGPTDVDVPHGAGLTAEEAQQLQRAADAIDLTIGCLQDRGWPVVAQSGGWEISALQEEQVTSYEADEAECKEASGLADMAPLADTPERIARLYAYEVELVTCLRAQGVDVPSPPSEQTFAELRLTDEAWAAYNFVDPAEHDPQSWEALERACPPYGSLP